MRHTVLIADSNAADRGRIIEALEGYEVEVRSVDRDDAAYESFLECGPTIVLIDVLLPRRGGLDLLRRVRAVPEGKNTIVIVLCPVKGCADLRAEALERLGAAAFLEKPVRPERLRHYFDRHLQSSSSTGLLEAPFSLPDPEPNGDLQKIPFVRLFRSLVESRYSGRINLSQGQTKKVIFLQSGDVVFSSSNRVTETLGRHLLSHEKISEKTYRAALDTMQETRGKFGGILVDMGALDSAAVDEAVRDNVREKTLDIFGWMNGQYALTAVAGAPADLPGGPLRGRDLLLQGILEKMVFGEILALIRPNLDAYLMAVKDPTHLAEEFPSCEAYLPFLESARGFPGRPLQDVLAHTNGESEIRLLFVLLVFGQFAFTDCPDCTFATGGDDIETLQRLYRAKRQLENLRGINHFRVLGVSLDATDSEVRNAYLEHAKTLHPDVAGDANSSELAQMLSETFSIVHNAYETLSNAEKRKGYLAALHRGEEAEASIGANILEAETIYQRGLAELRKRKWSAALPLLREAYRMNPNEAEYSLHLGIALMNLEEGGRTQNDEEARRMLRQASELAPTLDEPMYRLGLLAKREGDFARAQSYFQHAVQRNPRHVEAQREIRLMRSRGETKPAKGVLDSIIGRKAKP